ncbi:MAG: hypothetical protein AB8B63_14345 [Granulosicoccus sp.]
MRALKWWDHLFALTQEDLTAHLDQSQPGAFAGIGADIAEMAQTTENVIDRIARSTENVRATALTLNETSTSLEDASVENRQLIAHTPPVTSARGLP